MVNGKAASSASFSDIGNKELLEFYQNKFDEFQKKEDKYKEKVDKHLKELIADRYELEAEVFRRGEKISDLQKALVDLQLSCFQERERFLTVSAENERLKNNEEILHKSMQQVLTCTKDRDLRDRIIYILEDPKVDIGYKFGETKSAESPESLLVDKKSSNHQLQKQVEELQSKLDDFSRVSKSSSDILLEDCKQALTKSKETILEEEEEIRKLQKRLQETESQLNYLKRVCSPSHQKSATEVSSNYANYNEFGHKDNQSLPHTRQESSIFSSKNDKHYTDHLSSDSQDVCSKLKNIKFALNSLSHVSAKLFQIFRNIFSSQVFIKTANLTKTEPETEFVKEEDITQLRDLIRQSTRLSYDISRFWESIKGDKLLNIGVPSVQSIINKLETNISSLAVATAKVSLPAMELKRAAFFDYLTRPTFTGLEVKETSHSEYATEVIHMQENVKSVSDKIEVALGLVDQIITRIEQNKSKENENKMESIFSSNRNRTYPKHVQFQDHLNLNRDYNVEDSNDKWAFRRTHSESRGVDDVKRKIDKTLIKIEQVGNGEYFKDKECCKHLAKEISTLSVKLKALYEDFNTRNLHDYFSEYSYVTLSKLETLAKQSRDTVLSAEAQISAYRSNVKSLSQKLKDAEQLLSESIAECLGLKRKLQQMELERQIRKIKGDDCSQEKLPKMTFDISETAVKEVIPSTKSTSGPKRPEGPYECMFCKQGKEHKLCEEKIRELNATVRKLNTELKLLKQELKEEKKTAKIIQEEAEKNVLDSISERENAKVTIQSLQTKNASLMEQLKMTKNRSKNLDRYHRAEIEGFRTDIKNLKSKIADLEKDLKKAVLIYENDAKNAELLKKIHATATRTKTAVGSLKRLKAVLYGIETDIRHM